MKRLHIHIKTDDLEQSIKFYSAMFGQSPQKHEVDYAKWLLDNPAANIALTTSNGATGVDHVGISLDELDELEETAARLKEAGNDLYQQEETTCCYAQSNKYWAQDPQGAVWELFRTFGESETYGEKIDRESVKTAVANQEGAACCAPSQST